MQVAPVERRLDRAIADLVGGPDQGPGPDAAAGQPHGPAHRVMVATRPALRDRHAAECAREGAGFGAALFSTDGVDDLALMSLDIGGDNAKEEPGELRP